MLTTTLALAAVLTTVPPSQGNTLAAVLTTVPPSQGNDALAAWDDVIQYRCGVGGQEMVMPDRPSLEYLDEVDRLEEKFIAAFDRVEGGDADYEQAEARVCIEVLTSE